MHKERSVFIKASPEAVYDYVSDVKRHPEWTAQPIEMQHTGGPESGAGAEYACVIHFVIKTPSTLKIIEATRPQRFVYQCRDSSGVYDWTFRLEAENGGTRLTQSFDRLDAPFYIKVLQPTLLYPLVGRGMFDKGLAGIKTHMEGASAATSA